MARRFTFQGHASVTSTNELVKQAIEQGEPEGLVVFSHEQTSGYGRQGRTWSSPLGGSYESFLLRPDVDPQRIPTIALVAGLAVRRALCGVIGCIGADGEDEGADAADRRNAATTAGAQVGVPGAQAATGTAEQDAAAAHGAYAATADAPLAGADAASDGMSGDGCLVQLKWPNDVVCAAGKLAGISSEVHAGAVCVGIGVNVFAPEQPYDVGGKNVPAYLVDLIGDDRMPRYACASRGLTASQAACIERVARAVADAFETCYDQWLEQGLAPFADELRRVSSLDGKQVRVATRTGEALAEGTVSGIDDHGRLLVRTADGIVPVSSGEAHLL
ncbi:MAG: biotin--[acetyl-CoA-carboxylase] ligase [Eggerthellaceae bacterium]|jgi:BirA family biotin operon repressor/biotin-[acetyl-CoA-carboxylase] ligase